MLKKILIVLAFAGLASFSAGLIAASCNASAGSCPWVSCSVSGASVSCADSSSWAQCISYDSNGNQTAASRCYCSGVCIY